MIRIVNVITPTLNNVTLCFKNSQTLHIGVIVAGRSKIAADKDSKQAFFTEFNLHCHILSPTVHLFTHSSILFIENFHMHTEGGGVGVKRQSFWL